MNFDTGSLSRTLPSSSSIKIATLVTGLDIDAMRKIASLRIADAFTATLGAQTDPTLTNARQGFFLVYINSFNEWHEGHAFEPMKDHAQLTAEERALGYHNPEDGGYRLATLGSLVRPLLAGTDPLSRAGASAAGAGATGRG
jgi:hypothetical protein